MKYDNEYMKSNGSQQESANENMASDNRSDVSSTNVRSAEPERQGVSSEDAVEKNYMAHTPADNNTGENRRMNNNTLTNNENVGYSRASSAGERNAPRSGENMDTERAEKDDSHAGTTQTTNYGADIRGSWREQERTERNDGSPDSSYHSEMNGRMRD